MGQVMVVSSGKGGTGKTTLCAGVASCLAAEGCSVLCIDADVGLRNLDLSLGMADSAIVSFLDVMEGRSSLDDAPASREIPNLRVLTAPMNAEPEDLDGDAFSALLLEARKKFDWCLIDAPAGIGAGFRFAARYADAAMVVSTADLASMRDAARAADALAELQITACKIAVNRVTPRLNGQMRTTVDDVMDSVGLPLLGIMPEDHAVTLAASAGVPLILYTNHGAAEACLHLARRLRGIKVPLMRLK
ncbi:MAG: AAA family ATPase [Oscillospiraceae bacterium]|nr:AAA family ATPase [Oscillospiraceae bacterium]